MRFINKLAFFVGFFLIHAIIVKAQDTFSIVAVDSAKSEVGSAGASCVDLTSFPQYSTDFLAELLPGLGAINTQAFYLENNQINARNQLLLGNSPASAIQWLQNNDDQSNPEIRQYGIAALINGSPETAAFTGSQTNAYTGHRLGKNYAIQGNILLGPEILDSMESRFLRAKGDLKCKLMYAMQGANVLGADSRCAANGTSSLFAFLKVAQASDTFGNPSFLISVQTQNGSAIEPIDSLQKLFDNAITTNCDSFPSTISSFVNDNTINISPNPVENQLFIKNIDNEVDFKIFNMIGTLIKEGKTENNTIDVRGLKPGVFLLIIPELESPIQMHFIKY
ncbi:MAG: DUF1028 domain-containing protein [Cytophagales bacterium]